MRSPTQRSSLFGAAPRAVVRSLSPKGMLFSLDLRHSLPLRGHLSLACLRVLFASSITVNRRGTRRRANPPRPKHLSHTFHASGSRTQSLPLPYTTKRPFFFSHNPRLLHHPLRRSAYDRQRRARASWSDESRYSQVRRPVNMAVADADTGDVTTKSIRLQDDRHHEPWAGQFGVSLGRRTYHPAGF